MFFIYPQEAEPAKELCFYDIFIPTLQRFIHTFMMSESLYDGRRTVCTAVVIQHVLQPPYNVYDGRHTLSFYPKPYLHNVASPLPYQPISTVSLLLTASATKHL